MNASDLLPALIGCAVGLTVAAVIVTIKATLVLREGERRKARLKRQSAELEAEKAMRTQTFNIAAQVMLQNSDLFAGARKFENL